MTSSVILKGSIVREYANSINKGLLSFYVCLCLHNNLD